MGRWAFDEAGDFNGEPRGKLGVMTAQTVTALDVARVGGGVMNGPEGLDWDAIDWSRAEAQVCRLRQRIFKASRDGDLARVRNLQKLMLRSHANTLTSVRRVTEHNRGRGTPGADGRVALTCAARAGLAVQLHRHAGRPLPVLRVYIPKKGKTGARRPLGIPAIADRAQQQRVRNALEPEWEARFEPRSYGFRPGRGCHDAIAAIYTTAKGDRCRRLWVADCDLSKAFDKIDHGALLARLGSFPARDQIRGWMKAGVIENRRYTPTEEGTPQGGVISPLLLNIALHGMEQAAGVKYRPDGRTARGSPLLVRYADDFTALCHSRQQAEEVITRLAGWLAPRGLSINQDKTQIVSLSQGFDFLGFNVRRYQTWRGGKLLIKPSKDAVTRIQQRLTAEIRALRGASPAMVIGQLNPIIRGWAAYYRIGVSKQTFTKLDYHLWQRLWWWARRRHPKKPRRWVAARHFGRYHPARDDRWVFGDAASGAYLHRFAWTQIQRHVLVEGAASPDDPTLTQYWAIRRRKTRPPLGKGTQILIKHQDARCPACGDYLLYADTGPDSPSQWEQWFRVIRTAVARQAITRETPGPVKDQIRLVHAHCARQHPAAPQRAHESDTRSRTPLRPA